MRANKSRNNRSIAIIGEGETEWFYFDSLRTAKRYPFKIAPAFPQHADISHFVKMAIQFVNEGYDYVVCLIDMDRLLTHPAEMASYSRLKRKTERLYPNIEFIETSPCTEFWFLLHFLPGLPRKHAISYNDLVPELQRYLPGYEKTRRYFRKTNIYNYLMANGSFELAMLNAERLSAMSHQNPEDKLSYSEIHKVFKIIDSLSSEN
jgi:hypothetical protein